MLPEKLTPTMLTLPIICIRISKGECIDHPSCVMSWPTPQKTLTISNLQILFMKKNPTSPSSFGYGGPWDPPLLESATWRQFSSDKWRTFEADPSLGRLPSYQSDSIPESLVFKIGTIWIHRNIQMNAAILLVNHIISRNWHHLTCEHVSCSLSSPWTHR